MPMIDVTYAQGTFPEGTERELTAALLRAEGVAQPGPAHLDNTGCYLHPLPAAHVHTARQGAPRTVRVQVLTPPGALPRAGQRQLTLEATQLIAKLSGDPTQAGRTWVLLTEAAEGGWGIAGTAFGKEEFAALLKK